MKWKKTSLLSLVFVLMMSIVLSACGGGGSGSSGGNAPAGDAGGSASDGGSGGSSGGNSGGSGSAPKDLTKVSIQLKWVPQAQFAGIYVAKAKGFFADEGIDVDIHPGGPDVIIEQQVVNGSADIGITGVDSLLVNQEHGLPIVAIAQILQKSSQLLMAKTKSGIDSPEKMKGKRVGNQGGSQQFQLLSFLDKYGMSAKNVQLVKQGFTMDQLLNDQLDVAMGAIFNEYHVILENGYKPEDVQTFSFADAGVGMLEDVLIAKRDWLANNRDLAVRTTRAILKGWQYAIANQKEAIDIVMKEIAQGSSTRQHQETMLLEIAKLIMPPGAPASSLGQIDPEAYQNTANIAEKYGIVKKKVDLTKVYDQTIAQDAAKGL
ncbi:ABC transporter substrate-binding protein [Paenibacillus humicola]|uniref:ABC transporter substrate-binding protein n=1 Tax=Paenibacillus humicola TaxID=3110540 RepID=UPI00237ACC11|nr:ABC transporter substrate-binding protein [Paenibacillus humicola]